MSRTDGSPRRKLAIIIGAHKAGTTSLFRYLGQHPSICLCSMKEPAFFAGPAPNVDLYERGLSWYEGLWPFEPHHVWGVEASPYYTMFDNAAKAAGRMAALGSDWHIRLLYVLRHPVDRIDSEYRQGIPGGWIPARYASSRMQDIFARSLETSRYAYHLRAFAQRFPRDRIHVVLSEHLSRERTRVLREILSFLELDPEASIDSSVEHNVSRSQHPRWLHRLAPAKSLLSLYRSLPEWAKTPMRALPGRSIGLTPEQRERAWAALGEDVQALRNEFGVDVSAWEE